MQQRQIWFYEQQVRLAREFDLPVILHVRKSSDRLLEDLAASTGGGRHCPCFQWQRAAGAGLH